jgi:hypothetical protein
MSSLDQCSGSIDWRPHSPEIWFSQCCFHPGIRRVECLLGWRNKLARQSQRLTVQLLLGREREAGCEARIGISKNVSDKIPPEAIRLVPMERMSVVLDAREAIM